MAVEQRYRLGALFAASFALLHLYWAADGGLAAIGSASALSGRPVFRGYAVIAAVVFAAATLAGLRLAAGGGDRILRLARFGSVLALVRGCVGLMLDLVGLMVGNGLSTDAIYDLCFLTIGALFLASWSGRPAGAVGELPTGSAQSLGDALDGRR
jgi:hypothetical protein